MQWCFLYFFHFTTRHGCPTGSDKRETLVISAIGTPIGLVLTFTACAIFGITRFADRAWLVLVCVPLMVIGFSKIRKHYEQVKMELKYDFAIPFSEGKSGITIVPIASVNKASVNALTYAVSNFKNVIAVTVISADSEEAMKAETDKIERQWEMLNCGVRLIVIHSQYRSVARRLQRFVELELEKYSRENITVVIPQFINCRWWHSMLHNKTGGRLFAWLI